MNRNAEILALLDEWGTFLEELEQAVDHGFKCTCADCEDFRETA